MYKFGTTKIFDKALKLCRKRGYPIEELRKAIAILVENGSLPSEYKPHILHGNHEGEWEAHIKPNWLLVWEQNDDELTLLMLTTGTHSDVFGKTRRIRNLMASNQGCHFQKISQMDMFNAIYIGLTNLHIRYTHDNDPRLMLDSTQSNIASGRWLFI